MEDTDSMAIVATEHGGIDSRVPAVRHRKPDGREAVKALSWKQVDDISEQICCAESIRRRSDRAPFSKLKMTIDDPKTAGSTTNLLLRNIGEALCTISCWMKSAASVLLRKGINNKDDRWSEHGLGHLLNPTDPESEDREWIAQVWLGRFGRARTENRQFQS